MEVAKINQEVQWDQTASIVMAIYQSQGAKNLKIENFNPYRDKENV